MLTNLNFNLETLESLENCYKEQLTKAPEFFPYQVEGVCS